MSPGSPHFSNPLGTGAPVAYNPDRFQVESCQELLESGAIAGAGAAVSSSLRAHLSRVDVRDGHAFLHADEVRATESLLLIIK